jgi:putative inorganic carbon (HCO3(-)) transporter
VSAKKILPDIFLNVSPHFELLLAAVAAALWYKQGGAIWYAGNLPGPWPLILLGVMWLLYWIRTGFKPSISSVDVLLALFTFSAWIGTQTAYDPAPAWAKFWLVVGAWGLFYAFKHQPDRQHIYVSIAFCGLFGAVLTTYYLMTNAWWTAHSVKMPVLVALSEQISASLPRLSSHAISPNVTGGMLAVVLPFYVPLVTLTRKNAAVIQLPDKAYTYLRVFWWVAGVWSLLGMLLTTSRGAWLAVLFGFILWVLWHLTGIWCQRKPQTRTWNVRLAVMAGIICLAAITSVVIAILMISLNLPGSSTLANRLSLWRDSLLLARDATFTGLGLGTYLMNNAIYTLLIHVGYIFNSHNLFLDLLNEQGILGLIPYFGLILAVVCIGFYRLRNAGAQLTLQAGLISLTISLVHGIFDDILYGSRGLLLLFVPLGIILAGEYPRETSGRSHRRILVLVTALCMGLLAFLTRNTLIASFYANLGAVNQAQVELANYDPEHFAKRLLDAVRQEENLDHAIHYFQQALQWNPQNPTARKRLASIDLSRGDYQSALLHMETIWDAGYRDPTTRLLYGDALIADGKIELAAAVIKGLEWTQVHVGGQAWYRYWLNEDWARAAYAWRTLELLDLGNTRVHKYIVEAESRACQEP